MQRLAGLGRYEEAVPEYKAALKQTPGFTQARLNLAIAYYKMGRISDAATQLVRVHAEDPGNHQAVLLLGDCYLRMGQNKDVIHLLEPEQEEICRRSCHCLHARNRAACETSSAMKGRR